MTEAGITSPLICRANQSTGFYMTTASVMKELNASSFDIWMHKCQLFCHTQGIYLNEYLQVAKH